MKWRSPSGRTAPSSSVSMPPSTTQSHRSVPEEKGQRPLKIQPPSARFARPIGAYGEATQVSGSSPQISSCTARVPCASSKECTPTTEETQPAEAEREPMARMPSKNSRGCVSAPPKSLRLQRLDDADLAQRLVGAVGEVTEGVSLLGLVDEELGELLDPVHQLTHGCVPSGLSARRALRCR